MRTPKTLGGLAALLATMAAGACGSLDSGKINIVDAPGGTSAGSGGASGGGGGSKGSTGGAPVNGGDAGAGAGSDQGGQAGAGGEGGVTLGGSAGAAMGGVIGTGGDAGAGAGAGLGAGAGAGGEAGGSSGGCSKGSECVGATPICDVALLQCRACTSPAECVSDDPKTPICRAGGCVGCLTNTDCAVATPVCGTGNTCRTCSAGSECASLACNANGRCATAAQVVYALAETGVYANDCGTIDRPCGSLGTAATKLTATRPFLVLVANQSVFNEGATLPANTNVTVVGNHVRVAPYDGSSAFIINGGNVVLDDVVVATTTPSTGAASAAISCTGVGTKLKFFKGSVSNANASYGAAGLQLSGCDADVQQATFTGNHTGILSSCPSCVGGPTQTLTVERSLFQGNRDAIAFEGASFLIRNNLFLRNGNTSYVDIIGLRATSGILSFNTMVGNDNNCSYEGGLVSCEGGAAACGTFSSNLSWGNMLNPTSDPPMPCPSQVYYSPPSFTNTLAETTWPGTGNVSADPKFVDATKDNYTPGPGSPALNKGSTVAGVVPAVDYYGNPRGSAPDIGAIEAQ